MKCRGLVPLVVPVAVLLLRARRVQGPYLDRQPSLRLYPAELMLRNHAQSTRERAPGLFRWAGCMYSSLL